MKNLKKAVLLLAVPGFLAAAGALSWNWLLHSEPGARWLFSKVESSMAGSVGAFSISGDLGSGLSLAGLYFDDGNTRVEIGEATISVDIDLLPPAIGLETLHANSVLIRLLKEQVKDPGQQAQVQSILEGLSLPLPLHFGDFRVAGLEFYGLAAEQPHVVESITARGNWYKKIKLEQVSISAPGQNLDLAGELGLSAPHPLSLELQARGDFEIQGSMNGSLESSEVQLVSGNPQLKVSGSLEQLLLSPGWNLVVSSPLLQWPLDAVEPDVMLTGLNARSSGKWPDFNLELAGGLELDGLEASRLNLAGSGSDGAFTARQLTLEGPELSLRATGRVSWANELQVALNTTLERLEPIHWLEEWPEGHPVSGALAVEWQGEDINISALKLKVVDTPMTVEGHGSLDIVDGSIDGELNWNDASWPPGNTTPLVISREGHFLLSGTPGDWKLDGSLAVQTGEYPEGQLKLAGTGNQESLDLALHESSVLGGTISGQADWNWTDKQPFNVQLSIQGLETQSINPQYPAILNSRLTATGEVTPFRLGVDLQQLTGTFLDHPINGEGGFHIEQSRVFADGLKLRSGESSLTLNGSLYDASGVEFAANVDSLATLSTDFSGTVAARGILSLNPDSPKLSVSLSGQQLVLGSLEISQIETRTPLAAGFETGQEIIFTGLVAGEQFIDSVAVRLGGSQPLQKLAISALLEGTRFDMALDGSVVDWQNPFTSGWKGQLSELQFNHPPEFDMSLEKAAAIEWHPSNFSMAQACFDGTREARLCLESSWKSQEDFSLSVDLASLPVALVGLITDTDLEFTQILSGTLNWSQSAGGQRSGGARIEMSPGSIKAIDEEYQPFVTGPGLFSFDLAEGQLRQGELDVNFPELGDIDVDFSIPDFRPDRTSPIQGQAKIDLSDISSLRVLFPVFDTFKGALDIDLDLSGTLTDPAFNGNVSFLDGHFGNSGSGFSFSEINISGKVSENDRSVLKGSFNAGKGKGEVSATIDFVDIFSPVIDLALKGSSLKLIEVPELSITADPDIALNWRDNTLEINGRLLIPNARLAPSYIPQSTVTQSEDVVIVAGELPTVEKSFIEQNAVKFRGNLEVEIGKGVLIDLDVAKISVTGQTVFSWNDDLVPLANGNFNLAGDIQAFGQSLQITKGRIRYPGTPADNPHLNIRAEREIFGNVQIRRAGLLVAGTLNRPVIEPYTVPMTTRERAQTLLVTGSDFNYEQGVGAVDVGMYVLPRLHVSYGIGVFEDGNVLKVRYDLGRGFGVRATSGQRESGMDISYTIER